MCWWNFSCNHSLRRSCLAIFPVLVRVHRIPLNSSSFGQKSSFVMNDLKIFTSDCGCTMMKLSSPCWSKYKILPNECWTFKKYLICLTVSARSSFPWFSVVSSSLEIMFILCNLICDICRSNGTHAIGIRLPHDFCSSATSTSLDFSRLISESFLSFPFIKNMSSYIMRCCRLWFLNISPRSWINLAFLLMRSSYKREI